MGLKHSYTVLAPLYDPIVAAATSPMRRDSLASLQINQADSILLAGVGTGLDFPFLTVNADYYAMDLTAAMLKRARRRLDPDKSIYLHQANVMRMPYADASFDCVVLHLILAVVAEPLRVLQEASRTLKPGGRILVLDKFLRPGQRAPGRRLLNMVIRHFATRTDVVFEDILSDVPSLKLVSDEPCLAGGWFRRIQLEKHQH